MSSYQFVESLNSRPNLNFNVNYEHAIPRWG